jgi:bifunctional non-homologous end joining protein LigD
VQARAEGIVSKRADAPYRPARSRRLLAENQVPQPPRIRRGGLDGPEGSRPDLGALLLAYYAPDGRLVYAGCARAQAMPVRELARLAARLKPPLATDRMPLDVRRRG